MTQDLKNKFFYRTEEWSWLTKEQIQVYDSRNPRIITMDPWPQKIYLEALGTKTVGDYIKSVERQYPRKRVPNDLEDIILKVLHTLIYSEKIISLSTEPVTVDVKILKPRKDNFRQVKIEGTWNGLYYYDRNQYTSEGTAFNIHINKVKGQKFWGTVEDDLSSGRGTPGTGTIKGKFSDKDIWFEKQMPIATTSGMNGEMATDKTKKHPSLIYKGSFSADGTTVYGKWKFKKVAIFWRGLLPKIVELGSGSFTMKKHD